MNDKEPNSEKKEASPDLAGMLGMGGFLDGVSNLITKFSELAERGESIRKTSGETESGKPFQTSAGFTVKFGSGRDAANSESGGSAPSQVAPFSASSKASQRTSAAASSPAESAPRVREPHIDVYEEEDHTLLLAEMPGVAVEDLQLRFDGDKLFLEGASKSALFKAEIALPRVYEAQHVSTSANNGVIEIRLSNG